MIAVVAVVALVVVVVAVLVRFVGMTLLVWVEVARMQPAGASLPLRGGEGGVCV